MKICTKCGAADRGSYGACKPCDRAKSATYRAANPDKVRASMVAWSAANQQKRQTSNAAYRAANAEKLKAYRVANRERRITTTAAWYAANPDRGRIKEQNRRARKRSAGGQLSPGLAAKLERLQRGKCACGCKQRLGDDYHLDHVMPIALGGANEDWNIQLLRSGCNMQKHATHPIEFMQQKGFLI